MVEVLIGGVGLSIFWKTHKLPWDTETSQKTGDGKCRDGRDRDKQRKRNEIEQTEQVGRSLSEMSTEGST